MALTAVVRNEANRTLWQTDSRDLATATSWAGIEDGVGFGGRPTLGDRSGMGRVGLGISAVDRSNSGVRERTKATRGAPPEPAFSWPSFPGKQHD